MSDAHILCVGLGHDWVTKAVFHHVFSAQNECLPTILLCKAEAMLVPLDVLHGVLTSQGFLKSERLSRMVQSGSCSANDFREVFRRNIERRVRSLPEIDGLSKETVLSSWLAKYDAIYRGDEDLRRQPPRKQFHGMSELILSKEQLYEMFQQVLGIKKFEHQLLYTACQVGGLHMLSPEPTSY